MPLFGKLTLNDIRLDMSFDEIRKRARVLVIDDDADAFPCELLQNEGYNVRYWSKVENLHDLENGEFDLIVLDIFGVAPARVSENDGLGILEHLKKHNPAQLVIAYSGQKYDLSQSSFWSMADDYLGKPSSLIGCKEKIDGLLRRSFTPQHYWQAAAAMLQEAGVTDKKLSAIEGAVAKSLKRRTAPSREAILNGLAIAHHTAATIWVLIQVIAKFYTSTP